MTSGFSSRFLPKTREAWTFVSRKKMREHRMRGTLYVMRGHLPLVHRILFFATVFVTRLAVGSRRLFFLFVLLFGL